MVITYNFVKYGIKGSKIHHHKPRNTKKNAALLFIFHVTWVRKPAEIVQRNLLRWPIVVISNGQLARNDHITWCQSCLLSRHTTPCDVIISCIFLGILWLKRSHRYGCLFLKSVFFIGATFAGSGRFWHGNLWHGILWQGFLPLLLCLP